MRTIAVMNQKGGTCKTTTAVNLAAALGEAGRRVVVLDLDPQASASAWLGHSGETGREMLELLSAVAFGSAPPGEGLAGLVRETGIRGVDAIPAGSELARADRELATEAGALAALRELVASLPGHWDYLFIDTPPSLGGLGTAALLAAREVLIPVEASTMAIGGLASMLGTVERTRRLNPDLEVAGILACRIDGRTRIGREVPEVLRERFAELTWPVVIRESVRFREAWAHREPITAFDPRGAGTQDYRAAAAFLDTRTAPA